MKWTDEKRQFLKDNVKGKTEKELQEAFNKHFNCIASLSSVNNQKGNMHLSSGIVGGRFEKEHAPANKGKKWNEFMSKQGQSNSLKTTFRKGNKAHNCDPIGTEKWKLSGSHPNDIGFLYVKVADGKKQNNWKQKHRLIWKEANGEIPRGYKVIFADGDRTHIKLSNLILVSNSQMLIMNRQNLIYDDQEATKTGSLIAKVIDRTNQIKRKK